MANLDAGDHEIAAIISAAQMFSSINYTCVKFTFGIIFLDNYTHRIIYKAPEINLLSV